MSESQKFRNQKKDTYSTAYENNLFPAEAIVIEKWQQRTE
jgi:hypothetical protein